MTDQRTSPSVTMLATGFPLERAAPDLAPYLDCVDGAACVRGTFHLRIGQVSHTWELFRGGRVVGEVTLSGAPSPLRPPSRRWRYPADAWIEARQVRERRRARRLFWAALLTLWALLIIGAFVLGTSWPA